MKKLVFFTLFILFLTIPKISFASGGDISQFDVTVVAHQNGTMDVEEVISYELKPTEHHGIFRDIPKISKVGDLYRVIGIEVTGVKRDGQKEDYTVSDSVENTHLKIGNANREISGEHIYTIDYKVTNGIGSNFPDHDEIYWNVTGNNWPGIINHATAIITTDFSATSNGNKCFTGVVGSTSSDCTSSGSNRQVFSINSPLGNGEGLSVVVSYPSGTFPKTELVKKAPSSFDPYAPIIGWGLLTIWPLLNIVLPIFLIVYYRRHRNKVNFGKPAVNFDFPEDKKGQRIAPAEAGIMDTAALEKNDVIATIYDLAIRKYIKIENKKKDIKVVGIDVGDKDDFIISKLKDYPDVNQFEKRLLDRLFESGDSVHLTSLKKDFYKTFEKLEKDSFDSLIKRGFYIKNPKWQKLGLLIGGIFSVFLFGSIPLALTLLFLSFKMNARTQDGDMADHQIDGLKLFLSGRSREYSWNADNLQVVEKMIPYAMALGFIKEFMKQFEMSYPDYQPYWYTGYHPFYTSFSGLDSSFSSNVTTSAPSSSSGMGGGGFSGGGGGGGGGGGW